MNNRILSVVFGFAFAFFGCDNGSGGGDGDSSSSDVIAGGSSSSVGNSLPDDLTKDVQVYLDGAAFTGNADAVIVFRMWDEDGENLLYSDTINAGRIENGKLTLNLPDPVDGKYLQPLGDVCKERANCVNELSNTLFAAAERFYARGNGQLYRLRLESPDQESSSLDEGAIFVYMQEAGRLIWSDSYTEDGYTYNESINDNLSKGWNALYMSAERDENIRTRTESTNSNTIKGSLVWTIYVLDQ